VEDTPLPISLTGDDADGDPLVFTVVSTPSHGALSGTAPQLTYTPAADYFGADQFSFTVFDGLATSVPVVVSIAVSEVNDPPIPGNDAVVVTSDRPSTLDPATLLINDVTGPANEAGQVLVVTAVLGGADTHGTVTLDGGVITYTLDAAGFTGTASFGYTLATTAPPPPIPTSLPTGGTVTVDVVAPTSHRSPIRRA
jgi:hypothetical protein